MEKGEKIKVYFRMKSRCYGLFNIGTVVKRIKFYNKLIANVI